MFRSSESLNPISTWVLFGSFLEVPKISNDLKASQNNTIHETKCFLDLPNIPIKSCRMSAKSLRHHIAKVNHEELSSQQRWNLCFKKLFVQPDAMQPALAMRNKTPWSKVLIPEWLIRWFSAWRTNWLCNYQT